MAKDPKVTIIIATFNSEKKLPLVFESIRKQTFPKKQMEVLVVDGGSDDDTVKIAKKFGSRIINNNRTEPVYAKYLGYKKAKGRYVLYLDHDEVMANENSIKAKVAAFESDERIKAVISGGYINPPHYPFINNYINEFGDPFSFFIYKLPKTSGFFIKTMKMRYKLLQSRKDYLLFDLSNTQDLPIIELVAGASMLDVKYFKEEFPQIAKHYQHIPHLFYLLYQKLPYICMTKNDYIVHYSSDTLSGYLGKIRWRIKNNIYHKEGIGLSGFYGRDKFQPGYTRMKKYLFLPYSFSIVFPFWDAIYLCFSRKNWEYFLHVPLCIYTASLIVYHYILQVFGVRPRLRGYGL